MPLLQGKSRDPFVGARKGRAASRESSLLPDVVLYTSNTSTREAAAGGLLQVLNQPGSTVTLLFQVTRRWEMRMEERKERLLTEASLWPRVHVQRVLNPNTGAGHAAAQAPTEWVTTV